MNDKPKIKRTVTKTKSKMGRPPTRDGIYDPPRILGRVSHEDWATLKAAAKIYRDQTGESFTQWAMSLLLKEAGRILTNKK